MQDLLNAPDPSEHKAFSRQLKAYRDRAVISVFAFHGVRCSELIALKVGDIQERRGVKFLCILGKGDKIRYIPAHPHSLDRLEEYLDFRGDRERDDWLFCSVRGGGQLLRGNVYKNVIMKYALQGRINPDALSPLTVGKNKGVEILIIMEKLK